MEENIDSWWWCGYILVIAYNASLMTGFFIVKNSIIAVNNSINERRGSNGSSNR